MDDSKGIRLKVILLESSDIPKENPSAGEDTLKEIYKLIFDRIRSINKDDQSGVR